MSKTTQTEKRRRRLNRIAQMLPEATITLVPNKPKWFRISWRDAIVFFHTTQAWETQNRIRSTHRQRQFTPDDLLQLDLPLTLEELDQNQAAMDSGRAQRREQEAAWAATQEESRRQEADKISDFFSDLTIRWEFVGFTEGTDTLDGEPSDEQWSEPKFRYTLHWAEKRMSFSLSYVESESSYWDEYQHRHAPCTDHFLEVTDIQGDEPAFNWQCYLQIGDLYDETQEYDADSGEIVPTWLDISKLILDPFVA